MRKRRGRHVQQTYFQWNFLHQFSNHILTTFILRNIHQHVGNLKCHRMKTCHGANHWRVRPQDISWKPSQAGPRLISEINNGIKKNEIEKKYFSIVNLSVYLSSSLSFDLFICVYQPVYFHLILYHLFMFIYNALISAIFM